MLDRAMELEIQYLEYRIRISNIFRFWSKLSHRRNVFGECTKIFQQLMRILYGQYFNHVKWHFISEP
jgi:hypothetical protein